MKYNLTAADAQERIKDKLLFNFGITPKEATNEQFYKAVAMMTQELMKKGDMEFREAAAQQNKKTIYYLCMEFLMGRSLKNDLWNLGIDKEVEQALKKLGVQLEKVYEMEPDAGLGNGGLGRLAACYLDALATENYASMGYSLRYKYGIFRQKLIDGWQTEFPDFWLPGGEVWLQPHPDKAVDVSFNGYVEEHWKDGYHSVNIVDADVVKAIPYDMLVPGNSGKGYSRLRLWAAKNPEFDMKLFNDGEYIRAIERSAMAETITKVLYPEDNHAEGKSLRLNQQYFLVSATLQDIISRHLKQYGTLNNLPDLVAIHMNDTHPVLAVPELMRILVDECGYAWHKAWDIVTRTIAYTNHTVMKEALECWSERMFAEKLPRIYQIVCEINRRICEEMSQNGVSPHLINRISVINDGIVRMANLAVLASYKINGVSALHSEILKDTVFNDFYTQMPYKFTNVTNGIAHRRWLNQSNPELSKLITELIGSDFASNAASLKDLERYKDDKAVLDKLAKIKYDNKVNMAKYIKENNGVIVDPNSIFDVQIKRLHEYKRQLMNAVHILSTYQWLKSNPQAAFVPKTYIFGAKAAPGYYFAKQIIQFIIDLANKVNSDPAVNQKLKVIYLEDYRVSVAEKLIPAAEISEQISLAGTEASGTSNMKFMINGALTIGTLDGANVEIHQNVTEENMFLFGMKEQDVEQLKRSGYNPRWYYQNNHIIKNCIDSINSSKFNSIADSLLNKDPYMVLADFGEYSSAQQKASLVYEDKTKWNQMSLINIANAGFFAADRAIQEYAKNIWNLTPVEI
ncbi:alpha-1,4 glucan phosphorylase [Clostridia bacterium]|nr:alpha-1,4 glucan phosphorylase [Clostridia bacterium]